MGTLHRREQIPEFCPACLHAVIDVTVPYVPSEPGLAATDKIWDLIHANEADRNCECDCIEELDKILHNVHKCLACSYPIWRYEPEIEVRMRGFGKRFRHADDDACRRAMSRDYGRRFVSGGLVRGKR